MRIGWIIVAACGGGHGATIDATGGGSNADAGQVTSCDPPGHFGVPDAAHTFVLPPNGTGFPYADVQAAFPAVDWTTLERLYIPAGSYTNIQLGNLPTRDADHPLVITNQGGQVVIGHNPTGNYIWSFGGGSHWILTGRYDAESQTGDVGFTGHACGAYADSKYGIVSDDDYAFSAPYLHMGISVGGSTEFEIEYVEVKRSGFAGIRLLNDPTMPNLPMTNVSVHDVYVHDTGAEGFYFGWTGTPPSNKFPGLQIYNCRILRTGNEALQIQDLADGTHVHHNTFISGGIHWLDNGLGRYQDNLSQISTREGTIEIDHNVFIDGANTLVSFFSSPQSGDGDRNVTFHDNYFSDAIDLFGYLNGTSAAGSTFAFDTNVFRGFQFAYATVDPTVTDPGVLFGMVDTFAAPLAFTANHWAGAAKLVNGITGGDGTSGNVTATGNINDTPDAIALVGSDVWETPGHHLTAWTPTVTVAPAMPAVTYHAGDFVTYGDAPGLYRCTADSTGTAPTDAPAAWTPLATPSDDVRVAPGTTYAGYGVQ